MGIDAGVLVGMIALAGTLVTGLLQYRGSRADSAAKIAEASAKLVGMFDARSDDLEAEVRILKLRIDALASENTALHRQLLALQAENVRLGERIVVLEAENAELRQQIVSLTTPPTAS